MKRIVFTYINNSRSSLLPEGKTLSGTYPVTIFNQENKDPVHF